MPMKKRYYSVGGGILAEQNSSGRIDYMPDALGSVVATTNATRAMQCIIRYKPFGSIENSSGSKPAFTWVGSYGYRETGIDQVNYYVRARHYSTNIGSWRSLDPLWPRPSAFLYVLQNPVSSIDPSGTTSDDLFRENCKQNIPGGILFGWRMMVASLCSAVWSVKASIAIENCLRSNGILSYGAINCFRRVCEQGKNMISCTDDVAIDRETTCICKGKTIKVLALRECASTACGGDPLSNRIAMYPWWFSEWPKMCDSPPGCGRSSNVTEDPTLTQTLVHELLHVCAACQQPRGHNEKFNPAAECILKILATE